MKSETGPLLVPTSQIWKINHEDLSPGLVLVGKGCPGKTDMTSLHLLKEKHKQSPAEGYCGKAQGWRGARCLVLGDPSLMKSKYNASILLRVMKRES